MKGICKVKDKMISSHDIEDQYLTDKISVAKIIRISFGSIYKNWDLCNIDKPLWEYSLLKIYK